MDAAVESSSRTQVTRSRRTRWLAIVLAAFLIVGGAAAAWWGFYGRFYQDTDDAYVAGDLVNVSSQISGTVVAIDADETDYVQVGQEVVRLDDTDARIALQQAEDQLAKAVRQVHTVFTSRDELSAVLAQRRADLSRAQTDLARRSRYVSGL